MTRYEQLKPGMEFLYGSIKTIDDAVNISYEVLDCWDCQCKTSCRCTSEECKDKIRAYLEEEIE